MGRGSDDEGSGHSCRSLFFDECIRAGCDAEGRKQAAGSGKDGMIDAMLHILAKDPGEEPKAAKQAARASEMAAQTIERKLDPSVPPEERAQRRRRLTKGPPEFRVHRVDLPRAKGK
jgi:hypothetical protein